MNTTIEEYLITSFLNFQEGLPEGETAEILAQPRGATLCWQIKIISIFQEDYFIGGDDPLCFGCVIDLAAWLDEHGPVLVSNDH